MVGKIVGVKSVSTQKGWTVTVGLRHYSVTPLKPSDFLYSSLQLRNRSGRFVEFGVAFDHKNAATRHPATQRDVRIICVVIHNIRLRA